MSVYSPAGSQTTLTRAEISPCEHRFALAFVLIMDFGHWLSGAAGRHADRVAVEAPDESVSYRELLLRAVRAAGALHARGVGHGDPVALLLEPGLPFVEALHGCLLLGA